MIETEKQLLEIEETFTAVDNEVSQKDLPEVCYIISDMEFDQSCDDDNNKSNFEVIKNKFKKAGYEMPRLVFNIFI
jgi:hypothetical protein